MNTDDSDDEFEDNEYVARKLYRDEVLAYFSKHIGPVHPLEFFQIVPTDPPICVHVIPAGDGRHFVTLFTTGVSAQPMNVPPEAAQYEQDFRFAELFIQLPGDWKYNEVDDPCWGWPIHWLRSMGKYPHQNDTWYCGPYAIVSNGDPPEALAPNVEFDSVMLLAEKRFERNDGQMIQLYRLIPLYPEERMLEAKEDIGELLRSLDRLSIPFVVDPHRPKVVGSDPVMVKGRGEAETGLGAVD